MDNPPSSGSVASTPIRVPSGGSSWVPVPAPRTSPTTSIFYVTNHSAVQALEFDINQSVNGRKYIFGTECNPRGNGQWDVWDTAGHRWVATGIGCGAPSAYNWHHLTIEAQRVGASTHFIAITLDGRKSYVNCYFNTYGVGASELNVAVQLDTNNASTNYSLWADKISLGHY